MASQACLRGNYVGIHSEGYRNLLKLELQGATIDRGLNATAPEADGAAAKGKQDMF